MILVFAKLTVKEYQYELHLVPTLLEMDIELGGPIGNDDLPINDVFNSKKRSSTPSVQ